MGHGHKQDNKEFPKSIKYFMDNDIQITQVLALVVVMLGTMLHLYKSYLLLYQVFFVKLSVSFDHGIITQTCCVLRSNLEPLNVLHSLRYRVGFTITSLEISTISAMHGVPMSRINAVTLRQRE